MTTLAHVDWRMLRRAILMAAVMVGIAALGRPVLAAEAHPDFGGVWAFFQHDGPPGPFGMAPDPKLSARGQAIVDTYRAKYDVKKYDMEPNQYCVEHGMPTAMFGLGGMPFEMLQQPKRLTLFSEAANQYRRIFVDGRKFPDVYPPTPIGYSIGHWEGDTLVVETRYLEEWYLARWPHSENAKFIERFSLMDSKDVKITRPVRRADRLSPKVLVDQLTLIDPDMYDQPTTVNYYYTKLADDEIFTDGCTQGLWQAEFDRRIESGKTVKPK